MLGSESQAAAILVAAENVDDAGAVAHRLAPDFSNVRTTVSEEAASRDYEAVPPAVLILAFKGLEKSEHYLLGLMRSSAALQRAPCRTIVLCSKEEVPHAFELCKKGYFDDYVLHWPLAFDGMRLSMSVLLACREAASRQPPGTPEVAELFSHVRHVDAVDGELNGSFSTDERARLEPHMAQVRHLADKVRQMRMLVMVVEDDDLACKLIERALRDEPIDLVFTADSKAALFALRQRRPQVILMDVRLPGMDGVMLTRAIKATPSLCEVPIIMLTGSAQRETVKASMAAGAESFLVKPVDRAALIAKLREFLPPSAPRYAQPDASAV